MSEKTLILGVDPGKGGALVFWDIHQREIRQIFDMPLSIFKNSKGKKRSTLDLLSLAHILKAYASETVGAVIEQVGASPRDGVVGAFTFGFVTGAVAGAISAHFIPMHSAKPSIWKTLLSLTTNKDDSRLLAQKTFPNQREAFKRKKDDGRAEAALLAKYGERIFAPVKGDLKT